MLAPIHESRWAYCFIWCADMAIAFKPTCGLNSFALQYVNSQCQHDSLLIKLAAKLHLLTETSKFMTDYFDSVFNCGLCILDFVSSMRLHGIIPLPSSRALRKVGARWEQRSKLVWTLCRTAAQVRWKQTRQRRGRHAGAFPSFTDETSPGTLAFPRPDDKVKKSIAVRRYVSHQPCAPLVGTVERAFLEQMYHPLHITVIAIVLKFQYFFYCCHIMI